MKRLSFKFERRDLWIGVFVSANGLIYVCPLPMCLFTYRRKPR